MTTSEHHAACPYSRGGRVAPERFLPRPVRRMRGRVLGGDLLRTLIRIRALPDAMGRQACECGHPEMRRLPDGVFLCPACRAEVTP